MAYSARIICDSLGPNGKRLTTFEVTYPKFVHGELMTHRMLSRNTASSRAIPVKKTMAQVVQDPVIPVYWGKNQRGMQAREELLNDEKTSVMYEWLRAKNSALSHAVELDRLNLHKQIVNRVIEPWMWITAIVSATEWANFFSLRCHPDAQPEIRVVAEMMRDLYLSNKPEEVNAGVWHMPYIDWVEDTRDDEINYEVLTKISVARCARVSYLTHDGRRDHAEDLRLYNDLVTHIPPHMSPFEHVAQAVDLPDVPSKVMTYFGHYAPHMLEDVTYGRWGNFVGWRQYRKGFSNEVTREYTHDGR